ncbi:MAG: ATP-binding protein [Chlamydiia bacterium]|nr:ATP-binding protein [Chlamydiia bacterium]
MNKGVFLEDLVGRKAEIAILESTLQSRKAELIAVYGRRRIGKTFLISNYYRTKGVYFEMTGIKNGLMKKQIKLFVASLKRSFPKLCVEDTPKDWYETFLLLEKALQTIKKKSKIILFFDEFPWMDTHKSDLVKAFEYIWNAILSKDDRVIAIICGSSVSWMIRKIFHNKGGLHGRLTAKIRLKPFCLHEAEQYFVSKRVKVDRKQLAEIFMTTGGVPKYLSYVKPGFSASRNIQEMCFSPGGPLTTEFDELYESLFDHCQLHVQIIEALSEKRYGLTFSAVAEAVSAQLGGNISKALKDLIASNFIQYIPFFGNKRKDGRYRVIDEYSMFYLNWIKQAIYNYDESLSGAYWPRQYMSTKYKAWAGYVFEGLCLTHIRQIINALKLSVVAERAAYWNFVSKNPSEQTGAQIDLIIDRADHCINLCEIKFCSKEFKMTKAYADRLNERRETFRDQTKTRKTLINTLITPYGAATNQHYLASIDEQLTLDDLFLSASD